MNANLSARNRTLIVASVLVVFLFAGLAVFGFLIQANAWKLARKKYDQALTARIKEDKLIEKRKQWTDDYEAEREKMPIFPEGEKVDTHWQRLLDAIAAEHHISIPRLQSGKEEAVGERGEVWELPIDTRNWEGSLSSLIRFLYALENAQEAMFDVRSISIQPSSAHKGFLKGDFILTCAYLRGEAAEDTHAAPAASDEAPVAVGSEKKGNGK